MYNSRFPKTSSLNPTITIQVNRTLQEEYDTLDEALENSKEREYLYIFYEGDDGNKWDTQTGDLIEE